MSDLFSLLTKEADPLDVVARLIEATATLSGVTMCRAGGNYLADNGNNVFIRINEYELIINRKVNLSVDCRPELEKSESVRKKVEHLKKLFGEVFSESDLPFENRYRKEG